VSKDTNEEKIPLQDSYKKPPSADEVRDEILYRKVEKPVTKPRSPEILKFF
jgi:hypothetical protein